MSKKDLTQSDQIETLVDQILLIGKDPKLLAEFASHIKTITDDKNIMGVKKCADIIKEVLYSRGLLCEHYEEKTSCEKCSQDRDIKRLRESD